MTTHVRYARELPVPPDVAFAWLTDLDDEDVARADAPLVHERTIVERTKDRIVYLGAQKVLGRVLKSRVEVALAPPDRWTSRIVEGSRTGSWNDYRLEPLDGGLRTKLVIDYHFTGPEFGMRLGLVLARPFVRRGIVRMWDGFARAMQTELGVPDTDAATSVRKP